MINFQVKNFSHFLESIKNSENSNILDSLIEAYSYLESLSTDDANEKKNGQVLNYVIPGSTLNGNEDDQFSGSKLSPQKLEIVRMSQFGMGRQATFPDVGRSIVSTDPLKNQYTGSQYYAGDSGNGSSSEN